MAKDETTTEETTEVATEETTEAPVNEDVAQEEVQQPENSHVLGEGADADFDPIESGRQDAANNSPEAV